MILACGHLRVGLLANVIMVACCVGAYTYATRNTQHAARNTQHTTRSSIPQGHDHCITVTGIGTESAVR